MALTQSHVGPYELFALALSISAQVLLAVTMTAPLDSESRRITEVADLVLCGFFFIDFLVTFVRAPNRWRYVYTWGWLDLLASIPAVDALRFGRIGRIVRILRVLRVIKAGRLLVVALTAQRRTTAGWGALFIALLMVFGASLAILEFERVEGNIKTAEDALWWAMTTVTTVGYGDRYPVTTEGRLVAVALMSVGVGLFGTLSGVAASLFMQPAKEQL
jgi:voltage-gated potassium channel